MGKFLKTLFSREAIAIFSISELFTHDAHNIVSKRGWILLNKDED